MLNNDKKIHISNGKFMIKDELIEKSKKLSDLSKSFLRELLDVIEKYNLDLMLGDKGISFFSLKERHGDFMELGYDDLEPYEDHDWVNLEVVIRLMLGLPSSTKDGEPPRFNKSRDI